jgi:hypothetical protein
MSRTADPSLWMCLHRAWLEAGADTALRRAEQASQAPAAEADWFRTPCRHERH